MRIEVDITDKELNALEDILICWNLCPKHKKCKTEKEMAIATVECKNCIKEYEKLHKLAWAAEAKLWMAYLKKVGK